MNRETPTTNGLTRNYIIGRDELMELLKVWAFIKFGPSSNKSTWVFGKIETEPGKISISFHSILAGK